MCFDCKAGQVRSIRVSLTLCTLSHMIFAAVVLDTTVLLCVDTLEVVEETKFLKVVEEDGEVESEMVDIAVGFAVGFGDKDMLLNVEELERRFPEQRESRNRCGFTLSTVEAIYINFIF